MHAIVGSMSDSPATPPVVVVTGANGLVGARICAALAGRGVTVRAVVRRPGTAPVLPGVEERAGDFPDPGSRPRSARARPVRSSPPCTRWAPTGTTSTGSGSRAPRSLLGRRPRPASSGSCTSRPRRSTTARRRPAMWTSPLRWRAVWDDAPAWTGRILADRARGWGWAPDRGPGHGPGRDRRRVAAARPAGPGRDAARATQPGRAEAEADRDQCQHGRGRHRCGRSLRAVGERGDALHPGGQVEPGAEHGSHEEGQEQQGPARRDGPARHQADDGDRRGADDQDPRELGDARPDELADLGGGAAEHLPGRQPHADREQHDEHDAPCDRVQPRGPTAIASW